MHFIMHWLGLDNASGAPYLLWSGFFGDLTIIGGLLLWFKHKNCHVKGCKSVFTHQVPGTPFVVCKNHNPAMPRKDITHFDIVKAHKEANK